MRRLLPWWWVALLIVAGGTAYAQGQLGGQTSTGIIQTTGSVPINVSVASTTQLIAATTGQVIYVTHFDFTNGTGTADNVTFEYGTGTSCGTGTTVLSGPYGTGADMAGTSAGAGIGPIMIVPAGNALCILTSAAVQVSGVLSYTQLPY